MLGAHNNNKLVILIASVQIWSPRSILGMRRYFWVYLFHSGCRRRDVADAMSRLV